MATATDATQSPAPTTEQAPLVFTGPQKNLVTGVALTAAGLMAMSMGLTDTFFVEATAWTFLIWGVLLIYSNLLEMKETYTLSDESLVISNPLRLWGMRRTWQWKFISRLDALIKRNDPTAQDVKVHLFYTPADEPGVLHRVDMAFNPALIKEIVSRAKLKAEKGSAFVNLDQIPQDQPGVYIWKK